MLSSQRCPDQVPSEIHPLETRATGQAVTVFVNFIASFVIGQFFQTFLCGLKVSKPFHRSAKCNRAQCCMEMHVRVPELNAL
jgi:hypothetical protein